MNYFTTHQRRRSHVLLVAQITIISLFLSLSTYDFSNHLWGCTQVMAQNKSEKYDISKLPVPPTKYSAALLKQQLNASSSDPVEIFLIIRRADTHDQMVNAFLTLDQMRVKEPKKAVIQSAYCLVFNWLKGEYGPGHYNYTLTDNDYHHYDTALKTAYADDPNLWLPYMVEGYDLVGIPSSGASDRGLKLLEKAVGLAPKLSIPHMMLGNAYCIVGTHFDSYEIAAKEFHLAQQLKPVTSFPALSLIDIYTIRIPNKANALQAKRDYLSTLPPGYKMSEDTLGLLEYVDKKFNSHK